MNKIEEQIQKALKSISNLNYVSAVFLFGSQAADRARSDSDIDLAVLTKNATREQELEVMGYGSDSLDVSLFSRLPLLIQFRILKEGKLLYCKDKKQLHETRTKTITLYLDYAPFINKFYKRVIQNV